VRLTIEQSGCCNFAINRSGNHYKLARISPRVDCVYYISVRLWGMLRYQLNQLLNLLRCLKKAGKENGIGAVLGLNSPN